MIIINNKVDCCCGPTGGGCGCADGSPRPSQCSGGGAEVASKTATGHGPRPRQQNPNERPPQSPPLAHSPIPARGAGGLSHGPRRAAHRLGVRCAREWGRGTHRLRPCAGGRRFTRGRVRVALAVLSAVAAPPGAKRMRLEVVAALGQRLTCGTRTGYWAPHAQVRAIPRQHRDDRVAGLGQGRS